MHPLIKENQYLVDNAGWGLRSLWAGSSKVVPAPPAPVHAAPDAAADQNEIVLLKSEVEKWIRKNEEQEKEIISLKEVIESLRKQIHELTASKFVVEELNRNMSDHLEGENSVRRLNRFEFELQPRQRLAEGEGRADYAEAGSPEISVTYSLVLDPAHRESDKYKNMEGKDQEKFNLKELKITSQTTQRWSNINYVCLESETDGIGQQHTLLKFYQNDPMDLTKQKEVTSDNPACDPYRVTRASFLQHGFQMDKYEIFTDYIIQQVRQLLLSQFQMVLKDLIQKK